MTRVDYTKAAPGSVTHYARLPQAVAEGLGVLAGVLIRGLSQHSVTRAPDTFGWTHRAPIFEHSSHCLAFGCLTVLMAVGH
jgi:hypothetical protein